jgi:hypothetical protein
MSPMANNLPQVPYRGGQYPTGASQRFNPASSSAVIPQIAQMAQYGPSPTMPVPNQGYYPQQPPMHQYYGGQMSPPQSANAMPSRQNMGFYPGQMMMGHYYPGAQYGQQGQGMPPSLMQGQYGPGSPTNANDPRAMSYSSDTGRLHLQQSSGGSSTYSDVFWLPRVANNIQMVSTLDKVRCGAHQGSLDRVVRYSRSMIHSASVN